MRQIAQLVRLIVMAVFKHGGAGDIANAGGRLNVGGIVARIVAELLHQRNVNRIGIDGQHVHQRAVRSIADGLLFVGQRSLGRRTPQRPAQMSPMARSS